MPPTPPTLDLATATAAARDALAQLQRAEATLRERHRAALKSRKAIGAGLEPADDIVAQIDAIVAAHVARWRAEFADHIVAKLSGSVEAGRVRPGQIPDFGQRAFTVAEFIALAPETAKAAFREIVEQTEYRAGAPLAERARLVAETDAEIGAIEREHEALVEHAAAGGLTLAHLASVQARRDREAAAAAREAYARDRRRELEAAIEAAPRARLVNLDARATVTRSSYIESGGRLPEG